MKTTFYKIDVSVQDPHIIEVVGEETAKKVTFETLPFSRPANAKKGTKSMRLVKGELDTQYPIARTRRGAIKKFEEYWIQRDKEEPQNTRPWTLEETGTAVVYMLNSLEDKLPGEKKTFYYVDKGWGDPIICSVEGFETAVTISLCEHVKMLRGVVDFLTDGDDILHRWWLNYPLLARTKEEAVEHYINYLETVKGYKNDYFLSVIKEELMTQVSDAACVRPVHEDLGDEVYTASRSRWLDERVRPLGKR